MIIKKLKVIITPETKTHLTVEAKLVRPKKNEQGNYYFSILANNGRTMYYVTESKSPRYIVTIRGLTNTQVLGHGGVTYFVTEFKHAALAVYNGWVEWAQAHEWREFHSHLSMAEMFMRDDCPRVNGQRIIKDKWTKEFAHNFQFLPYPSTMVGPRT